MNAGSSSQEVGEVVTVGEGVGALPLEGFVPLPLEGFIPLPLEGFVALEPLEGFVALEPLEGFVPLLGAFLLIGRSHSCWRRRACPSFAMAEWQLVATSTKNGIKQVRFMIDYFDSSC